MNELTTGKPPYRNDSGFNHSRRSATRPGDFSSGTRQLDCDNRSELNRRQNLPNTSLVTRCEERFRRNGSTPLTSDIKSRDVEQPGHRGISSASSLPSIMKSYIVLLFTALWVSTTSAFALQMRDLLGTWTGKHQETINGSGFAYKTSLNGKKISDGTIRITERGPLYPYVSTYTFRKDGKFTSRVTSASGSSILSTYRGTWKSSNGRISILAKGTDGKLSGALSDSTAGFRFTGNTDHIRVVINARR